jgi:ankyrin repeat protein
MNDLEPIDEFGHHEDDPRDILKPELALIKIFLERGEIDRCKTQLCRVIKYTVRYLHPFSLRKPDAYVEYVKGTVFELMKQLIENEGFDINDEECLFLSEACNMTHFDLVLYLLNQGANVEHGYEDPRQAPLRKAWTNKDYRVMELLVHYGAFDKAVLLDAFDEGYSNGDLQAITALLRNADATLINIKFNDGKTPLIKACLSQGGSTRRKIVSFLLNQNPDVNIKDNHSLSAFDYVCLQVEPDPLLIELLLVAGSEIDYSDTNKVKKAFMYVMRFPTIRMISFVWKHVNAKEILLDNVDINGKTTLMYACHTGDVDIVKQIFDAALRWDCRLDLNAKDTLNRTALWYACSSNRGVRVVNALYECGQAIGVSVDIHCLDRHGQTPLLTAVNHNDIETVKLLFELGAQDLMHERKSTALMCACQNGNGDMVKLLLTMETSDIHATTSDGMNAMLYALSSKNPSVSIVQELIDYGAILHFPNQSTVENEQNCWYSLCKNHSFSVLLLLWSKAREQPNLRLVQRDIKRIINTVWIYLTQHVWEPQTNNNMEFCEFLAMAYDLLMRNKYDDAPNMSTRAGRTLIEMMRREINRNYFFELEHAKAYYDAIKHIADDIEFQICEFGYGQSSSPLKQIKANDQSSQAIVITPPPIVLVKVYYQELIIEDEYCFTGTNSIQVRTKSIKFDLQ